MTPYEAERKRRFDRWNLVPAEADAGPCSKTGHSKYYTSNGYVHCGVCGAQLWKA